ISDICLLKREMDLHRLLAIPGNFKGRDHFFKRIDAAQERLYIDRLAVDHIDSKIELFMEAERTPQVDFFRHNQILRNGYVSAKPYLHQNAAGLKYVQPGPHGAFIARSFKHHIEIALIGSIGSQLIGMLGHVDAAVGADFAYFRKYRFHHIGCNDFPCTMSAGSDNDQRADWSAASDQNTLVQERSSARNRMECNR